MKGDAPSKKGKKAIPRVRAGLARCGIRVVDSIVFQSGCSGPGESCVFRVDESVRGGEGGSKDWVGRREAARRPLTGEDKPGRPGASARKGGIDVPCTQPFLVASGLTLSELEDTSKKDMERLSGLSRLSTHLCSARKCSPRPRNRI